MKNEPYQTLIIMKKLLHSFLLVFALAIAGILVPAQEAKASHFAGSDITFTYTGTPGWYLLRVNVYRDCGGITFPNPISGLSSNLSAAIYGQSSCGTYNESISMNNDIDASALEVCPGQLTECSGNNSIPGIQLLVYEKVIFLGPCSDWVFVFKGNARNAVGNLIGSPDWYTDAGINTTGNIHNSTPVFAASPVPYVCLNDTVNYNLQATDPDGDSLVYSLVGARTTGGPNGTLIPYVAGFSATQPFGSATSNPANNFPTTINPNTGQLTFKPVFIPANGNGFVVVVRVEEWRRVGGVLTRVGFTHRDVQVQVLQCNTTPPILDDLTISGAGQPTIVFNPDSVLEIQACQPYTISIPAHTNQAGAGLTMTSNAANEIPNSTFTVIGEGTQNVVGTLTFQANPALVGQNFFFTINVADDACPIKNDFVRAISLKVVKNTGFTVSASEDSICAKTDVQLNAAPRANTVPLTNPAYSAGFSWRAENLQGQAIDGQFQGGNNTIVNPVVTPVVTTRYILSATTSFGCTDTDSVVVVVNGLQPEIVSILPSDSVLCADAATMLNVTVNGPAGMPDTITWNYAWSSAGISDSTIANPMASYAGTDSMTYYLTVSNGTCSATDSLEVIFVPAASVVTIADEIEICIGHTVNLTSTATSASAAGSTYSWIAGGRIDSPNDSVTTAMPTIVGPNFYIVQVTTPLGCVVNDTVLITGTGVFPNMEEFVSPLTLCEDQTTTISVVTNFDTAVANPNATYNWSPGLGLSDPTSQSPTISYVPGNNQVTYYVTVAGSTTGACAQTDTVTVNFVQSIDVAPTASPAQVCVGDTVRLLGGFTPSGVFGATVNWTGSGVNANNSENTYAVPESAGVQTYNVEVMLSQNCMFSGQVQVNVQGVRPVISNLMADSPICYGETTNLAATIQPSFVTSPEPNIIYHWSANTAGADIADSTSASTTASPASTTMYYITASDNGACVVSDSILVQVGAPIDLSYSVSYNPDSLAPVPVIVTFTNNTVTTGPVDSVYWVLTNVNDPQAPPIILDGMSGSATYEFTENSQYSVTMFVHVPNCDPFTLTKPLWIGSFIVPNVITPNGDGLNDVFMIPNLKPNTKVSVFNRWGKKVADFGPGGNWAPGAELPTGIYFYSIDETSTNRQFKGWVEVIR